MEVKYMISPRNASVSIAASDLLRPWFQNFECDSVATPIPYLVAPLQPVPGMYVTTSLGVAARKLISSSRIKDAITGSKPVSSQLEHTMDAESKTLILSDTPPLSNQ